MDVLKVPVLICLFLGKFRQTDVLKFCSYSLNSRCCPSSSILAFLAKSLGSSSAISSLPKRVKFPPFSTALPNATSYPGYIGCCLSFQFLFLPLACTIDVFFQISQTSSKFVQTWLRRINRRILADHKQKNILNEKKFYFSKSTEISANRLYFSMFFFSFFYVVRHLRASPF